MDLNQVIYTVFHAEFESGSRIGPKPPQDPILTDFFFNPDFYKNPIFIEKLKWNVKEEKVDR